jgi:hypothetical protein
MKNSTLLIVFTHSPIKNESKFQELCKSLSLSKESPYYFVENLNAVADLTLVSGTTLDQYIGLLSSILGPFCPEAFPKPEPLNKSYILSSPVSAPSNKASIFSSPVVAPLKAVVQLESVNKQFYKEETDDEKDVEEISKSSTNDIRSDLQSIKLKMKALQSMQKLLEQAEKTAESMNRKQYRSFTAAKNVLETKLKDTPHYNMLCSVCNRVCHENCKCVNPIEFCIDISKREDVNLFLNCPAFSEGDSCSQCSSDCSYKSHYYYQRTIVSETRSLKNHLRSLRVKN